ncbi:hypothetical protein JOE61_002326 [Nocardioides salarius]|uniref:DUF4194 domain-containing protein n=1 Tax=Nocardioides salarius TaxID=374513 RepID=A0ABS2MBE0_9ACTN|nr:DUF4194 domain-containing protein [Nocardioides salarius]MBM7508512.1 hypothetical protein [Nocardioides salarius]
MNDLDRDDESVLEDESVELDDSEEDSDEAVDAIITAGLDPDADPLDRPPLFDEDTGVLTLEQRNTINALVKARFITRDERPEVWRTLMEHRKIITSRLHEQFKHLHVYPERGMAYAADVSQPEDGRKFVLLGTGRKFTREETAILVYLRHRYNVEMAAGQPVAVVEKSEIIEHVEQMQPQWGNKSAATKRIVSSLERVSSKFGLLPNVPGSPDTYRIHPAIEMFLSLEDVRRLDEAFRTFYADSSTNPEDHPEAFSAGASLGDTDDEDEVLLDE